MKYFRQSKRTGVVTQVSRRSAEDILSTRYTDIKAAMRSLDAGAALHTQRAFYFSENYSDGSGIRFRVKAQPKIDIAI